MDKQKVLSRLIVDLQSFLSLLDTESLSYIAQAQKKSLAELLTKLQTPDTPVEDAEYMFMSCPSSSPSNNTDTQLKEVYQSEQETQREFVEIPAWSGNGDLTLPPPRSLVEDDGDDDEEDTYEEAEPFIPEKTSSTTEKAESESSHYELYGEEGGEGEELVKDRAHYIQWITSQPCLRSAPESRLCGYLWRKRWLGQWSKQLFVIKNDALLCYRSAKDLLPQLEMCLLGCQVTYHPRASKRLQHQLRVSDASQTLVLGLSDPQQAAEWKKVIEEVSGGEEVETRSCSSLVKSERTPSCRSDGEEDPPALLIINNNNNDNNNNNNNNNNNRGFLNVLMNFQWQSLLCQVEAGLLKMFGGEEGEEEGVDRPPQYTVQLRGAEIIPGPDTEHSYRISLTLHGLQMAMLEASCSHDKERWLQLLKDGTSTQNHHGNNNGKPDGTGEAISGLQTKRFPTSNMYMDDPFCLNGTAQAQPIYSNTSILQHMFQNSKEGIQNSSSLRDTVTYSNTDFPSYNRKFWEVERSVQKLELTGTRRVGSETNLASAVKQNKHTSFRQSLAVYGERAQVGLLGPLLRRTASAKMSLKRVPSVLFIQQGKVCQRREEAFPDYGDVVQKEKFHRFLARLESASVESKGLLEVALIIAGRCENAREALKMDGEWESKAVA